MGGTIDIGQKWYELVIHDHEPMITKSFFGPSDNMSGDFEQIMRHFMKNHQTFQFKS